jgi:hypothetical protein
MKYHWLQRENFIWWFGLEVEDFGAIAAFCCLSGEFCDDSGEEAK